MCIDGIDDFTCQCMTGYTGVQCETSNRSVFQQFAFCRDFTCNSDIDECASTPCQNDGTCFDGIDGYACLCIAGYTGDVCEIGELASRSGLVSSISTFLDIDECDSVPCQSGGTCSDGINEFTCNCVPGHTGVLCETGKLFLCFSAKLESL